MGKKWDYDVPSVEVWKECLRVLKPGGHALVACGTRTQHRMAVNLEDSGFEIRDIVAWVYGSGFPKSHNISKALEGVLGKQSTGFLTAGDDGRKAKFNQDHNKRSDYGYKWNPTTEEAKKYEGWGTALKPAMELWTLCRKPLEEKTIASNILKYGTGGINIDECRVGSDKIKINGGGKKWRNNGEYTEEVEPINEERTGRFPANLIHSGEDEVVEGFPDTKSSTGKRGGQGFHNAFGRPDRERKDGATISGHNDSGSASRFFKQCEMDEIQEDTTSMEEKIESLEEISGSRIIYQAKASKSERNRGLEEFEEKEGTTRMNASEFRFEEGREPTPRAEQSVKKNNHPTVKPIKLMQYLVRLITPKGGTVLDPYIGSGSTGIGAKLEGFDFIGIEREQEYCEIAEARIKSYNQDKE